MVSSKYDIIMDYLVNKCLHWNVTLLLIRVSLMMCVCVCVHGIIIRSYTVCVIEINSYDAKYYYV